MRKKWQLSEKKRPPGLVYDPVTRERDDTKDPRHLAWIRSLPCAVRAHPIHGTTPCEFPVEAHHPTGYGLAMTAPDRRAVPLCGRHHRLELHDREPSGTFAGWTKGQLSELQELWSDMYERLGALRRAMRK